MCRIAVILLACALTCLGCKGSKDGTSADGIGAIQPGTWVLILEDEEGKPVPGAKLTLRGQECRGNRLIRFEGYSGPGSLQSDSRGIVSLILRYREKFGVARDPSDGPALDNVVSLDAAGFETVEFSHYELTQGRIGTPTSVAAVSHPATTTSAQAFEPPIRCYKIILRRKRKGV